MIATHQNAASLLALADQFILFMGKRQHQRETMAGMSIRVQRRVAGKYNSSSDNKKGDR